MNNIDEILKELYIVDPSLREKEGEVRKIIINLLDLKPQITVDEVFVSQLRRKLVEKSVGVTETSKNSAGIFDILTRKSSLALAGGVVAVLIVIAAVPMFYNAPGPDTPPSVEKITVLESGNILLQEKEGGVVVSEDGSLDPEKIIASFVKFKSQEEFNNYIAASDSGYYGFGGVRTMSLGVEESLDFAPAPTMEMKAGDANGIGGGTEPERVSETNVQVAGIDEPDIVKTDGKEIYFSPQTRYYARPMPVIMEDPSVLQESVSDVLIEGKILPPNYYEPKTNVIKAFPVSELAKESTIDAVGNLLLKDDTLVILENQTIYGYNVSDPSAPKEKWSVDLDSRNRVVQARLYNDTLYLISSTATNRRRPCPIPLFSVGGKEISVICTDIYHPKAQVSVNSTYHVSTIDIDSGEVEEKVSFVGSYNSTLYMSAGSIYVAYSYNGDFVELYYNFFKENNDLIPSDVTQQIGKLMEYDISESSKMVEFQKILEDFQLSLDEDEALKLENEMANRMEEYIKKHKRELEVTDIVKIDTGTFKVDAINTVPGRLLNQFSMDEYKSNLRVAVTVGSSMWGFGGTRESENDIYVLDESLEIIGQIQGLGLDERIYSARFIQDKGYLVTFKQIDPFFVLDLSNPRKPEVKGELKIPGYSSYLHPITKDLILGVGKEGSKVKISLFDVSNPEKPKEASKYMMEEYWSDILNTHHAFLMDDKFEIFFMPAGNGGYVFSYRNDKIELEKAVSNIRAKRALFIDDFLYIIGDDKIVVLDETNWERVNELKL